MPSPSIRQRLGAALTATVVPALLVFTAPPALAAGDPITLDVLRVVDGEYVVETVTVPATNAGSAEASLEARADVVHAAQAVTYRVQGSPDPYWEADDPQAVSSVRDIWSSTRGAGQIVAVLDTAVDTEHPDLTGAFVPGTDTTGLAADGAEWHGTGVAGVIAARADNGQGSAGMAPEARIMPVRVCTNLGCPSAAVARGVLWAADHGADVINMSLAGAGYSDVTAAAIRYALDKGVSVVASAGNSGQDGNPVMYPAANSGVIAVSATTAAGAPSPWAVHGWQADIATVGENLVVPYLDGSYTYASGTSFSGPAVAGAVALLRAGQPGITPEQVQAVLQSGVDSGGSWDRAWGAGRLDMPPSVDAAGRTAAAVTVAVSPGTVDVSWAATTGATSYAVRVDGVVRATVTGTSATVTGLVDGNQVAVDVQPSNGERSLPVLATVGPEAPATPALHSATLGGTSTSATVTLSASVAGTSASTHAIIRDGVSIGTVTWTLSETPQSLTIDIGSMPTHETRWRLRGVDDLGRTSGDSNDVVAGSGQPPAPGAVTGLAGRVQDDQALLTWDDLGTAYTYRVGTGGTVLATPRTAGAAVEAPPVGTSRTYGVAVVDAWGQVGPETAVTVTSTGASRPAAPGAPTGAVGDRRVTLSWAAAVDNGSPVTAYTVVASPGGQTVTTAGATTATVTGLTNGRSYSFTVAATNELGTGPASEPGGLFVPLGDPIDAAYVNSGGVRGPLGGAMGGRYATPGNGLTQAYQFGRIHWSPTTGAHAVYGEISKAYDPLRGESGVLGYPVGGRYATANGGVTQAFQFGRIHTSPGTGAYAVYGEISKAYDPLRGESGVLGYPVGSRYPTANGGVTQAFQNGRIHFSPGTGAHAVYGDISKAYDPMRGESGVLGYPVGGRYATANGGVTQAFQYGRIHSSPTTGAFAVYGEISKAYDPMRGESGVLGYPVGAQRCGLAGAGCVQDFQYGLISWAPAVGAAWLTTRGASAWADEGGPAGRLGYPRSGCVVDQHGETCMFQHGNVRIDYYSGSYSVWMYE